jgi:hypothetical protein
MTMPYALTTQITFLRRRALAVLVVALVVAATLAAATTSAHQTLVRAHIASDGTTVVSGFDGGAPLAPATKP